MTNEEKQPEMDDEEQSARFIEKAREIQTGGAGRKFDEAMRRVLSSTRHKSAEEKEDTESL